jgi:hypothetical protein
MVSFTSPSTESLSQTQTFIHLSPVESGGVNLGIYFESMIMMIISLTLRFHLPIVK